MWESSCRTQADGIRPVPAEGLQSRGSLSEENFTLAVSSSLSIEEGATERRSTLMCKALIVNLFVLVSGHSCDWDVVSSESVGVVGIPGFDVADFAPEFAVGVTGEFLAAGALVFPGFVARDRRLARRLREVGGAAAEMVAFDGGEVGCCGRCGRWMDGGG